MKTKNLPIFLSLFFASSLAVAGAQKIDQMNFIPGKDGSRLEIKFSGAVKFHVSEKKDSEQIVVDMENANLPAELTRVIDTSATQTPVVQITPYNARGKVPHAKLVIQLRESAPISSQMLAGKFVLEIKGVHKVAAHMDEVPVLAAAKENPKFGFSPNWTESDKITNKASANDKSNAIAKQLQETLDAPPEEKVYHGSKISFESSDADVHDIFRLVGEASGLNIITATDVNAKLNLSLKDLPWDQLLDIVLQQSQLKASVIGNVVRITTFESFNKEQSAKKAAIELGDQLEPVLMAIIPLSYAKADQVKSMVDALLVKSASASGAGGSAALPNSLANSTAGTSTQLAQAFVRGKIEIDIRSNSLVVTNTKDAIDRIRKLVKELDVPLPQVLIDSKIVVADETFSKGIGVSYGSTVTGSSGRAGVGAAFNSGLASSTNSTTGATTSSQSGAASGAQLAISSATDISGSSTAGGGLGFQVGAGSHGNFNLALQLGEANGVSKTIAAPRIVVNNKQAATISEGVKIATLLAGNGLTASSLTFTDASLNLTVTPQVTSAGSVLLDLDIKKDAPAPGSSGNINSNHLNTQVLVDSGSTLVLGGVYDFTKTKQINGIPGLMDLPFIGGLFRTSQDTLTKQELMVFVTPQILDTGSSGVSAN